MQRLEPGHCGKSLVHRLDCMPSVQCSSMFCCIGTGKLPEKSGNRSKFCWNGWIFVAIFPFLDRRKPIAILFYCNMNCGKNQVFSLKHSGCGKRFPQIHVEMSNPLCEMHKNAGETTLPPAEMKKFSVFWKKGLTPWEKFVIIEQVGHWSAHLGTNANFSTQGTIIGIPRRCCQSELRQV